MSKVKRAAEESRIKKLALKALQEEEKTGTPVDIEDFYKKHSKQRVKR